MIKKSILYLGIFVVFSGCGRSALPHSAGRRDDVVLITPEEIQTDSLKNSLEREIFLPTREEVYRIHEYSPDLFQQYQYWRNLVIIGWLGNDYIDNILSDDVKTTIRKEGGYLFQEEDMWVKLQSIIIIVGKNREETQRMVNTYGNIIYNVFREKEKERFNKVLYIEGIEKEKTKKMRDLLGASFDIPLGYVLSKEKEHFMTYIRKNPARLVTLYYRYEPIINPVSFRDSLFKQEFEGDIVYMKETQIDTVEFKKIKTIKIEGIWQNTEKVMGGPFVSYVFEKDGIWYYLDGHIFAPGKKKWPYLDEVDILLHTFKRGF